MCEHAYGVWYVPWTAGLRWSSGAQVLCSLYRPSSMQYAEYILKNAEYLNMTCPTSPCTAWATRSLYRFLLKSYKLSTFLKMDETSRWDRILFLIWRGHMNPFTRTRRSSRYFRSVSMSSSIFFPTRRAFFTDVNRCEGIGWIADCIRCIREHRQFTN